MNIFNSNIQRLLAFLLAVAVLSCVHNPKKEPQGHTHHKANNSIATKSFHEKMLAEISLLPTTTLTTENMVFIKGGTFVMGGNNAQARPDEFPQHKDTANDIWVDKTEVTNAQFKKFIEATGYITTAERSFEVEGQSYPPGALVFDPNQPDFWWKFVEGASWKHPYGPNSNIEGKDDHPVVQVSWYDAQAYCHWSGKRLPTEAEFEYLSRGQKTEESYPWGNDFSIATQKANFFQGDFPNFNSMDDGYNKTAAVKSFESNGFGLYDIAGNVWEWTLDTYYPNAYQLKKKHEQDFFLTYHNPKQEKVVRGGSYLCSESYCTGYRSAARMSSSPDTSLEHTGFRTVLDPQ